MKNLRVLIAMFLLVGISLSGNAQVSQSFNFQAVDNDAVVGDTYTFEIVNTFTSNVVFTEDVTLDATNFNTSTHFVSIEVGNVEDLSVVNWSNSLVLQVNGNEYNLNSVPMALTAQTLALPKANQPIKIIANGQYLWVYPETLSEDTYENMACGVFNGDGKTYDLPTRAELDAIYKQSYLFSNVDYDGAYWLNDGSGQLFFNGGTLTNSSIAKAFCVSHQ